MTAILSFQHIVGRGNNKLFYLINGHRIVGTSGITFYASRSRIECAAQCGFEEGCRTSNFDKSTQKCHLHTTDVCPETEASQTSSILYIRKEDVDCIDPWKSFEKSCYYLGNNHLSMTGAQQACVAMRGNLVKIDNSHENDWIMSMIGKLEQPTHHYIGLKKILGIWRWISDNSPLNFANWNKYTGEPSGDGNCVKVVHTIGWHFTWNDVFCDNTYAYICERC
ncbi:unnamed protein product [Mytilus coruscus]|uniref:MRC n=1 Tax=Mytilus coruscus TaxID=42192 RepID=A0A6J8CN97_MYTCO|nr:unnamed protein product [Mytilus coruscus]